LDFTPHLRSPSRGCGRFYTVCVLRLHILLVLPIGSCLWTRGSYLRFGSTARVHLFFVPRFLFFLFSHYCVHHHGLHSVCTFLPRTPLHSLRSFFPFVYHTPLRKHRRFRTRAVSLASFLVAVPHYFTTWFIRTFRHGFLARAHISSRGSRPFDGSAPLVYVLLDTFVFFLVARISGFCVHAAMHCTFVLRSHQFSARSGPFAFCAAAPLVHPVLRFTTLHRFCSSRRGFRFALLPVLGVCTICVPHRTPVFSHTHTIFTACSSFHAGSFIYCHVATSPCVTLYAAFSGASPAATLPAFLVDVRMVARGCHAPVHIPHSPFYFWVSAGLPRAAFAVYLSHVYAFWFRTTSGPVRAPHLLHHLAFPTHRAPLRTRMLFTFTPFRLGLRITTIHHHHFGSRCIAGSTRCIRDTSFVHTFYALGFLSPVGRRATRTPLLRSARAPGRVCLHTAHVCCTPHGCCGLRHYVHAVLSHFHAPYAGLTIFFCLATAAGFTHTYLLLFWFAHRTAAWFTHTRFLLHTFLHAGHFSFSVLSYAYHRARFTSRDSRLSLRLHTLHATRSVRFTRLLRAIRRRCLSPCLLRFTVAPLHHARFTYRSWFRSHVSLVAVYTLRSLHVSHGLHTHFATHTPLVPPFICTPNWNLAGSRLSYTTFCGFRIHRSTMPRLDHWFAVLRYTSRFCLARMVLHTPGRHARGYMHVGCYANFGYGLCVGTRLRFHVCVSDTRFCRSHAVSRLPRVLPVCLTHRFTLRFGCTHTAADLHHRTPCTVSGF